MKRFVKWLIAGGVILCVGVIILIIGLAANGWKWGIEANFEQREYVAQSTVSAYDISIAAGTVRIEFADTEKVTVSYPKSDNFGYEITELNGKLTVKYNRTGNFFFRIFMPTNIPETVVSVPYGTADFNLRIDAGKLVLGDGTYGNVTAELNAGMLQTGEITCGNFYLEVDAGKAELSSLKCGNLRLDIDAGATEITKAVCDKLTVEIDAGSARVSSLSCPDLSVDVDAGSVNLNVDGAKAEYNISVRRSAGSCNLAAQTGTDPNKRITVDVSAGSATVTFAN